MQRRRRRRACRTQILVLDGRVQKVCFPTVTRRVGVMVARQQVLVGSEPLVLRFLAPHQRQGHSSSAPFLRWPLASCTFPTWTHWNQNRLLLCPDPVKLDRRPRCRGRFCHGANVSLRANVTASIIGQAWLLALPRPFGFNESSDVLVPVMWDQRTPGQNLRLGLGV